MSQLYAMAPTPASTDPNAAPAAGGTPFMSLLPLVVIAVLFYFLLIRPQQKQAKEREKLLKDLKEGDKVVLVSGVFATVTKIEDEGKIVRLQIADNVVVKANRVAIERLQG
ncbi:MAG TPA: preprotein translocase subunit YajC [bacterium]|nr:preprotein translocase subunit YajC [bacterium]